MDPAALWMAMAIAMFITAIVIIEEIDELTCHHTPKLTKTCVISTIRGGIIGSMTGGLSSGMNNALMFAAVSPIMFYVERLISI